ncbi:Hypothetical predicted protein [Lecanosticta acicola]|uniref:Uncharacterized protein n=1 Tax=Lecanosticta acicola TaxID=111012 RepID=A0AAI8YZW4_9PEZI|nr:Hypothetical predicted protein [Lecanosticta acicola]
MSSDKRKTYKGNDQKIWRALFTYLKATYHWPELTRLNDNFGRAKMEQVALHHGWFIQWPLTEAEASLAKGDFGLEEWLYAWPRLPAEPRMGKYSYYLMLKEKYPECGDDLKKAHDLDNGRIVLGRKGNGQQAATPAPAPALALAPAPPQQEQQEQQQAPPAAPMPPVQEPATGYLPDMALGLGHAATRFVAEDFPMAAAMEENMTGDYLQPMQPEGGALQTADDPVLAMGEEMPGAQMDFPWEEQPAYFPQATGEAMPGGNQMDFAWQEAGNFYQAELFGLPMDPQGELLFPPPPAQPQPDFFEPAGPVDSPMVGFAPAFGPAPAPGIGMPMEFFQGEPSFASEEWTNQDVFGMMAAAEGSRGPPPPPQGQ